MRLFSLFHVLFQILKKHTCRVYFVLWHDLRIWFIFHVVIFCNLYQIFFHRQFWRGLDTQFVHQFGRHCPNRVFFTGLGIRLSVLGSELITNYFQLLNIRLEVNRILSYYEIRLGWNILIFDFQTVQKHVEEKFHKKNCILCSNKPFHTTKQD